VPVDSVPLDEDVTPQALLSCARYFVQQAQGYASVVTILSVDPLVQQLAHREKIGEQTISEILRKKCQLMMTQFRSYDSYNL